MDMNNKKIISFLLAVGVVVSSFSSVTFADVEEDVINAQAKYEEYQNYRFYITISLILIQMYYIQKVYY